MIVTMRELLTRCLLCLVTLVALTSPARAQGFAALVSPPRFELVAKPGQRLREVIEITNADVRSTTFRVKTADWSFDKNAGVIFEEALQPGSCRPWVAVERREITVSAGGKYRFRFEVAPPANAPAGECRFAITIDGDGTAVQAQGGPPIPVSGRIGVIVYVMLGNAEPQISVTETVVASVNGEMLPVLKVKNSGNAHGRLAGFLSGTDAAGKKLEFTPSSLPILPGETRAIALTVNQEDDKSVKIAYPIIVEGYLEWGDKRTRFEQRFSP